MKIELDYIQAEMIVDALNKEKQRLERAIEGLKEFRCDYDFVTYEIQAHNDLVKMIRRNN